MGIYRITNGAVGKALPLTAVGGAGVANIADVPVSSSAWLFENQSGTLGTNLNGSVIYVGGAGNVRAILSGVEGIQNKVTALNLDTTFTGANPFYAGFSGGSGYTTQNVGAATTTCVTTVPNSPATAPAGLTVNITAVSGVVTAIVINAAGANYSVGDIITVEQAGSNGDCKFCIRSVQSDLPDHIEDAVTFTAVPIGTILPVSVDYIVATGTTATGLVACK